MPTIAQMNLSQDNSAGEFIQFINIDKDLDLNMVLHKYACVDKSYRSHSILNPSAGMNMVPEQNDANLVERQRQRYISQNNMQMCLYKQNKFIDYFSHGYMVLNTIMSGNGTYVAYINCTVGIGVQSHASGTDKGGACKERAEPVNDVSLNSHLPFSLASPDKMEQNLGLGLELSVNGIYDEASSQDCIELLVYKFNFDAGEDNLYYSIELSRDICEDPELVPYYLYFSPDSKFLVFKAEWNHIYIINLETMERSEFFIPNERKNINKQVVHMSTGNYIVWYGYDEFVRIIELEQPDNKSPVMWRDKMIHTITNYQAQTRYFITLPDNYLLYMDKFNKVTMMKINLKKQRLEFVYDIAYPAIGYDDLYINGAKILFTNTNFTCTINLTDKSCRVTKNINAIAK